MKSLKVKFQNKKKRPTHKNGLKQESHNSHDQGHIGFLLRENTDAQKAKNQLRKASEQVSHEPVDDGKKFTWSNNDVELPFTWLDQMPENEVKNIVKNKIGGTDQEQLSSESKNRRTNCISYEQLRAKNLMDLTEKYQILQRNLFSKKSSLGVLRTQKSQQRNVGKDSGQKEHLGHDYDRSKNLNRFAEAFEQKDSKKIEELEKEKKRTFSKNLSTVVMKNRARIALVTPKIRDQSQTEMNETSSRTKNIAGVSTIYFRVPDFTKHNPKRAVTVHCETNSRDSLLSCKNNFYLKKTNTICVVEKQLQETNKCISLSNYKSMDLSRKSRVQHTSSHARQSPKMKQTDALDENQQSSINRLSMEKAAKTIMLKQEFQRLRKLLKKEAVVEFKIDEDCPIQIKKL